MYDFDITIAAYKSHLDELEQKKRAADEKLDAAQQHFQSTADEYNRICCLVQGMRELIDKLEREMSSPWGDLNTTHPEEV